MQTIELTNEVSQIREMNLSGIPAVLHVLWVPLAGSWVISFSDAGVNIIASRAIRSFKPLLPLWYDGQLMAMPVSGNPADRVGRNAWGNTHQLFWLTGEEYAYIQGGF